MKIRGHGSAVAIALAGLAVVIAASGTAYAVTATTVNIADPTNPSLIAHVDATGRLATVGPKSSVDVVGSIGFDTTLALTSPTTASFSITGINYSNPALNAQYTGTSYQVSLIKIHAGDAGSCTTGASGVYTERILGQFYLQPGDQLIYSYPAPLFVQPTGTAKYCIGLSYFHIGGGSQTTLYSSTVQLTAYVIGNYTGIGTAAGAVRLAAPKLLTR